MNRPDTGDLIAKALRDKLSEAEREQWARLLEEEPAVRAQFAEEQALERALERLPDIAISSNFTALTLQAAFKEPRSKKTFGRLRLPLLHATFARVVAVLVGVCAIGVAVGVRYHRSERAEMVQRVRSLTVMASAIGSGKTWPEQLFQDFDAVERLPVTTEGDLDMELMVALQK